MKEGRRLLLYEISSNGKDWTEQWLDDDDIEVERANGFFVRCTACKKFDELNNPGDSALLTPGDFSEIRVILNGDGRLILAGCGEAGETFPFPFNYCPKCGRKVR